jgi:hypothetical protein
MIRALLGVAAAVLSAAVVTGCVHSVSGSAVRATGAVAVPGPVLTEADLRSVLVSIDELNRIVGSTRMQVTSQLADMSDHSDNVSDPGCLGAVYGAEKQVYRLSGWTAVSDQVAAEPGGDTAHWVQQTAVLYPSAEQAAQFVDDATAMWVNCANTAVGVQTAGASYLWEMDGVVVADGMISQASGQQDDADGWRCQHALAAMSNATVEAWACGEDVHDEAATIAGAMVANARR